MTRSGRGQEDGASPTPHIAADSGETPSVAGSSSVTLGPAAERAAALSHESVPANGTVRIAVDELIPAVYRELRQIAHHHLRRERRGHTLNTTALVNEAYVKLAAFEHVVWRDRAHFLSIAARAMRRVLIDYAVARQTQKRGGAGRSESIHKATMDVEPRIDNIIAVDVALARLEQLNARLARVVECRFFAGMSIEETAAALALSSATVKREWNVARAWLNRELLQE
jgi:RNA polymerase sigma factor (TIGR02999 family)